MPRIHLDASKDSDADEGDNDTPSNAVEEEDDENEDEEMVQPKRKKTKVDDEPCKAEDKQHHERQEEPQKTFHFEVLSEETVMNSSIIPVMAGDEKTAKDLLLRLLDNLTPDDLRGDPVRVKSYHFHWLRASIEPYKNWAFTEDDVQTDH